MSKRAVTSAKMERLQIEFKIHYQKVCNDIGKESLALEANEFRIYDWRSPKRNYHLPAFMLIASSVGDEMINFIKEKRSSEIVKYKLNGSMDDEWRRLTVLFAKTNEMFLNGAEFNPSLAEALKQELDKLLAEWKAVGKRPINIEDYL